MDIKEQKQKGILKISEDVIENIVSVVVLDTEGVHSMSSSPMKARNIVFHSEIGKPIIIEINGDIITIDIYIKLKTGYRISDVAKAIQEKVYTEIQDMAAVVVSKINVHINDVVKQPEIEVE